MAELVGGGVGDPRQAALGTPDGFGRSRGARREQQEEERIRAGVGGGRCGLAAVGVDPALIRRVVDDEYPFW